MTDWGQLRDLGGVTVRPLLMPLPAGSQTAKFRVNLNGTIADLRQELRMLNAKRIVLELGVRERDIRVDGMPRADARLEHPGVGLSFESQWGPLRYATAQYGDWRDNLRAIVLSMEALRAVDRYGVSKRGEQYVGWRAIPKTTDPAAAIATVEQARDYLDTMFDGDLLTAIKRTHPDTGGNPEEFRRVMRARELLNL